MPKQIKYVFNLNPTFQTNNSEMLFDDECYLMPEEIGIPQHVQRVLKSPSFPIDSSRTLPHLSQIRNREVSGSLPNVSENSHLSHEPWAKVQTLPWAMVCIDLCMY